MNPLTTEWVTKVEGDFVTAQRELLARKWPNYDAACFHAQQCAEKYLKARLQEEGIAFTKTHDLSALLDLMLPIEPAWASMRPEPPYPQPRPDPLPEPPPPDEPVPRRGISSAPLSLAQPRAQGHPMARGYATVYRLLAPTAARQAARGNRQTESGRALRPVGGRVS